MEKPYHILVVDDLESNLALARTQLQDHTIETAGDLIAAVRKLHPRDHGFWDTGDAAELEKRGELNGKVYREAIPRLRNYDVLLTDLHFPAAQVETFDRCFPFYHHYEQSGGYPSEPLGVMLALYATRFGTSLIGVYTDGNHHSTAFNGMLDLLYTPRTYPNAEAEEKATKNSSEPEPKGRHAFQIGASRLMFFDTRDTTYPEGHEKRWDLVLQRLEEGN